MPLEETDFETALSYTRTGTAEFLGSDGLIQSVAADNRAIAWSAAGDALGIVLAGATEQLLPETGQPDVFLATLTNATHDDDAAVAPDGTTTAAALIESVSGSATHYAFTTLSSAPTVTAGGVRAWSVFVKANGRTRFSLNLYDAGAQSNFVTSTINLSAGTAVGSVGGNGVLVLAAPPEPYPNGWYLCTLIGTPNPSSSGSLRPRLQLLDNSGLANYAGDGTSGVYHWGHNLHVNPTIRPFIATTTAPKTRGADLLSVNNLEAVFSGINGTFKLDFMVPSAAPSDANRTLLHMDDGTTDNSYDIRINAGTRNLACVVRAGGAEVANVVAGVVTDGSISTVAFSYTTDAFRISLAGAAAVSDISGAVPTGLSVLYLGSSDDAGADPLDGILLGVERRRSALGAVDLAVYSAYPVE